jgi:hypothetical protein
VGQLGRDVGVGGGRYELGAGHHGDSNAAAVDNECNYNTEYRTTTIKKSLQPALGAA